jgi:ubiquitin C-terminal hydrolase
MVSLSRNKLIFEKGEPKREKIKDKIEFGLDLNVKDFLDINEADKTDSLCQYELAAVLIHLGTPYGGHYHAYVRDLLGEGNWNYQTTLPATQ